MQLLICSILEKTTFLFLYDQLKSGETPSISEKRLFLAASIARAAMLKNFGVLSLNISEFSIVLISCCLLLIHLIQGCYIRLSGNDKSSGSYDFLYYTVMRPCLHTATKFAGSKTC